MNISKQEWNFLKFSDFYRIWFLLQQFWIKRDVKSLRWYVFFLISTKLRCQIKSTLQSCKMKITTLRLGIESYSSHKTYVECWLGLRFKLKVSKSRYHALFEFSGSIKKLFSIDLQYLFFPYIFFNRFFSVEKCRITPHYLFCDFLTFWFLPSQNCRTNSPPMFSYIY